MKELIEKLKQILGCVSEEDVKEANELADKILAVVEPQLHRVSAQEIYNIVYGKYPDVDILLWDDEYYLPSLENWKIVLETARDWASKTLPPYKKNRFDCENFALAIWAKVAWGWQINPIGIAIGAGHAFLLFLAYEGNKIVPHTYEPQNKGVIVLDPPYLIVGRTVILG